MPKPHELVGRGMIPDDPRKKQKVRLTISGEFNSKGSSFIKSQNPTITDQQIALADVVGAALFPGVFQVPTPAMSYTYQQSSGCCVEEAAVTNALSAAKYKKLGSTSFDPAVNIFSPNYIYDQIKNGGCGGGSSLINCLNVLQNNGCVVWNELPFVPSPCDHVPSTQEIVDAALNKIAGYSSVLATDITAIKSILFGGNVLLLGFTLDYTFHYGRDFDAVAGVGNQDYTLATNNNYIWHGMSPEIYGPHEVALVGWDDSKNAFKIANSYSSGWGDAGFRWVDYSALQSLNFELYYITDMAGSGGGGGNIAPVANAGLDGTSIVGGSVTLDGSASSDPDGTINAWQWTQTSGPNTATLTNPTSPICVASNLVAGTYVFQLQVTDNLGATAVDSVSIVVAGQVESYNIYLGTPTSRKGKVTDHISWQFQLYTTIPQSLSIEYAASNGGPFTKILDIVPYTSSGTRDYSPPNKRITRYYRMALVTSTGSIIYSQVASIR